jgi:histidinol-phosphatase (PHP family)
MLVDYHVHAIAHGEYAYNQEWLNEFLDGAHHQGIKEIGFSEHDEFKDQVDFKLLEKMKINRLHNIDIKLGLEVDYIPGREEKIRDIIQQNEYDYIIGSVHYINGWGFDHPDFKDRFDEFDIDYLYSQYTSILMKMVQSNCFDVVGHIDLIKIWGHRPSKRTSLYYFEPVLKAIKKNGLAVEINSAGLRKMVEEIYPASNLVNMMFAYNIPIVFGSDAHNPGQLGEGLAEAYRSARQAGYKYFVRLNQHEQLITPIDY